MVNYRENTTQTEEEDFNQNYDEPEIIDEIDLTDDKDVEIVAETITIEEEEMEIITIE